LELLLRRGRKRLFERYWLPSLEAGDVGVQICPLYAARWPRGEARERALAQVVELELAVAANESRVCQVVARADLDDVRLRLVLSLEGVEPLLGDPEAFEEWFDRGVRSVSLTWNHPNEFAGGIDTPAEGLTDRGRALVRRFQELGVVLDLAHASEQTWRDVVEEGVPFSVTHAACRAVHDHRRNLADWQLEALAGAGGVLGMMALPFVVDPKAPTLERLVDHVDHAVSVMGIEHVGLGADFVDVTRTSRLALDGFGTPADYPSLVSVLRERGYDAERLEAITSGNWLGVLRETLPA
jgi:membrane dipeptidase